MAATGQGFQWWSRATTGMPSWPGRPGDGEGEGAAPGSLPGTAAWLLCRGLTTAGGFKQSRVKRVTVRREGTALQVIQQRGTSHSEVLSSSWPGKVMPTLPVWDSMLCCAVTRMAKARRGCHLPLLQSSWCLSPVPSPPSVPSRGSQHPWTHQAAEGQTTQLPAGTLFKFQKSASPPLIPPCLPSPRRRGEGV